MELRDYLHIKRLRVNEFAKMVDFDRNYISRVKLGHIKPGDKFIRAVERATNGEVTAADLLRVYYEELRKKPCTCCEQSHIVNSN